ncbi:unnamed protein product [Paramecium octaurelia]|uniref:Uncharacterized protein n=1 Tax=Paramecium octaurelia TaxID=43137 RepID=A0A8S1TGF1_PAROT|nr:unnamed protein product [Paramecium octaurelia]
MNKDTNTYDTLIKVVIVGNCNVGKSCILMRYSENYFTSQYYNTIGVDFKTRVIKIGHQNVKLQIWDTAGQERFKALTNNYYRDAHGVVIVYDVTERSTFDAVDSWIEDIDKYGRKSVQKLIVGNKADVPNKRKISLQEGKEKAKQFNAQFLETSAKTSENVDKLFISICEQVMNMKQQQPYNQNNNLAQQQQNQSQNRNNSNGCC